MTRVLVVHHDVDLSDQEVDALRRRGYDARQCMGPIGTSCPILSGHACDLAAGADVLVYDAFMTGEPDGARRLVEGMRELHPDLPIVLVREQLRAGVGGDGRGASRDAPRRAPDGRSARGRDRGGHRARRTAPADPG